MPKKKNPAGAAAVGNTRRDERGRLDFPALALSWYPLAAPYQVSLTPVVQLNPPSMWLEQSTNAFVFVSYNQSNDESGVAPCGAVAAG